MRCLGGDENDELTSLIAGMLPDGDLQRALAREKEVLITRSFWPALPNNERGATTWKMLGRRLNRACLDAWVGNPLVAKDEAR